ncbi:deoxyuridine 5'-triphosphate nucleotidohydrolase, mitochondrial-like isoform X2 [Bufo gargarizans]|uniref:deoxyuridine 5'-triphosphate nucleotidohydrolase, mitochondrial-like isoform X2 n=2 Tax=Bufo gargarizans TaxID=30331 RepID=UPI001CF17F2D|nr:deoxyuridine 5'-triphosphate nucleotidohydrolase, mitochondrial-like isoform X2 [Bufo gargarizans]
MIKQVIQTDNGSHFTGKEIKQFALENNIEWVYHMPYYPQAAGLIERMNGLLKGALKKMTSDGKYGQWRDNLSSALQSLNNRPLTESTTPLMRMLTPSLTIGKLTIEFIEYWTINEEAQVPFRGTSKSAGLDLHSLEVTVVNPGVTKIIPTGIGVKIPSGHYGQLATRSSYALKSLIVVGGVIDEDYQGEVKVVLINLGKMDAIISKRDRVAQLLLIPIYIAQIKETTAPKELTMRGQKGFGSTNEISVGAKIWIQDVNGPPSPAEVIAVGKDRALLVMRPGVEKWEYIPQEKCYLRE